MYVLVEYNENYEKSIKEAKRIGLVPVTLFNLTLSDKETSNKNLADIKNNKEKTSSKYSAVLVILTKIENYLPGFINNLKNHFDIIVGLGGLNKVNKFFLEQTNIDFLMDPQNSYFKNKIDFVHHQNSGLNHVLCNYAKEKGTGFLFSLNFIENNKPKNIAKEFGRINQNLCFADKYGINISVNFIIDSEFKVKSIKENRNILSFFDISNNLRKNNELVIEKYILYNNEKTSENFITDGIWMIKR